MIIRLTKAEVCTIVGVHFETILKATDQRVIEVTSKYDGFEVECESPPELPKAAPRPGDDQ